MNTKRIKILLIQSRICIGGPAIHTEIIARDLPKDRYKVILVGGSLEKGEESKFNEIKEKNVDIRIIEEMKRDVSFIKDIKSIYKLYKFIKKEKPDIVDTHTSKAGATGRIAARLAGVPILIHTFHGHVFKKHFSKFKSSLFVFIEKLLGLFTTKIIAISDLQYHDLVNIYKIAPSKKFIIIKLGIDIEQFSDIAKNNKLKESLGIKEHEKLIGIIGRLVPIKNHSMILRVLKKLQNYGLKAQLCIAGDGEEKLKIVKLCDEYGLNGSVHFLGWVRDLPYLYSGIDILALTSLNEGTPITVIEAMAAGAPIIATNVGGVADLLLNNKNGMLCKSEDEQDMASKIIQILNNDLETAKKCQLAKKFVQENYSSKRLLKELDQLYTQLYLQYNDSK